MPVLLVLGGTSDIGLAAALVFARCGWSVELTGRDPEKLRIASAEISAAAPGRLAAGHILDILAAGSESFWDSLADKPDAVLCAIGLSLDQTQSQYDWNTAQAILNTNFFKLVPILNQAAAWYEKQGAGLIIGLSSAAGERGLGPLYTYGAAKAALTVYLSGLRSRLFSKGVRVITVIPGFVRTKMTEGHNLPPRLTASPEQTALDIWKAVRKNKDVVYSRWFWRWIMLLVKAVPEFIFKRIKFSCQ
ncbi:MAG: SDR family NAD(P)-dependent oxidoreductase [Deltaproteobacteria bacterium]|jgi:short-subunit dehydrogenase|nr:SDR family NAD(P)-dependent oxidoreductase [Deltaproteobacteria bacterium]